MTGMPEQLSQAEIDAKSRQMIADHGVRASQIMAELVMAAQRNDQVKGGDLVREMLRTPDLAGLVVGMLTSSLVNLAGSVTELQRKARGPAMSPEALGLTQEELDRTAAEPSMVAQLDQIDAAFHNGNIPQAAQLLVDGEIRALKAVYENHHKEIGAYPDVGTVLSVAVMWMRDTALLIASESLHRLILQEVRA